MKLESFPLCWPDNVARTAPQNRSWPQFYEKTISEACIMVTSEINRLNSRRYDYTDESVIISTNIKPKLGGGGPLSSAPEPADTGCAVYFQLRFVAGGKWHERHCVLTCDKWKKVNLNLVAIAKDIEAQRARQRWGCTNIEQAFRGYTAIPEKCGGLSWWDTLKIPSTATAEQVEDAYKRLAKIHHPDAGGDVEAWTKIRQAFDQAQSLFR